MIPITSKGYLDLVKLLVSKGVDLNLPGTVRNCHFLRECLYLFRLVTSLWLIQDGKVSLHIAAENGFVDIIAFLLTTTSATVNIHQKDEVISYDKNL